MWVLRVYDAESDELVAEHALPAETGALYWILGFEPSVYGSNPLGPDALRSLDMAFDELRQRRESWLGRECCLDFDADPRRQTVPRKAGSAEKAARRRTRRAQPA
jgi:hypothetical protein